MHRPVLVALVALMIPVAFVAASAASAPDSPASGAPTFLVAAALDSPAPFTGTIAEVLDVPGYTYAHVVDDTGQGRWAVTLGKDLAVGTVVDVRPFGALEDFHSKKADRHFDQMIFATLTPRNLP
jgi:hypothetical protein